MMPGMGGMGQGQWDAYGQWWPAQVEGQSDRVASGHGEAAANGQEVAAAAAPNGQQAANEEQWAQQGLAPVVKPGTNEPCSVKKLPSDVPIPANTERFVGWVKSIHERPAVPVSLALVMCDALNEHFGGEFGVPAYMQPNLFRGDKVGFTLTVSKQLEPCASNVEKIDEVAYEAAKNAPLATGDGAT